MNEIVIKAGIDRQDLIGIANTGEFRINVDFEFVKCLNKIIPRDDKKKEVEVIIKEWEEWGSDAQNRLFHLLLNKYYNSKLYGYSEFFKREIKTYEELKIDIKVRLGGARTNKIELGNGQYYVGVQSWGVMKKKQRRECIDLLIYEMLDLGINIDNEKVLYDGYKKT